MLQALQNAYFSLFYKPLLKPPINKKVLFVGFLLIVIAGIRVYHNLYDYMDIVYGDEAVYMKIGLNIAEDFNRDWGPIYCLWYKFLSIFIKDTVQLYYFNFAFIAIIAALVLYATFIFLDIHPLVALYFALCFVASRAIVPLWPRISLFTLSILLSGIILLSRLSEWYKQLLVFCTVLLIACYARPELYLSFIISLFVFLIYFIKSEKYKQKNVWPTVALFAVTILLLHSLFLFPSNQYAGYPRSLAAFYQHFLINRFFEGLSSEYDWIYWKDVHHDFFKNSKTIWEVIWNFPNEFFWHVGLNIKRYFAELFIKGLCLSFPYLLGKNKLLIAGSLAVTIGALFFLIFPGVRSAYLTNLKKYQFYFLLFGIIGIPTVFSAIFVFPREHYVLLNYMLLMFPLVLLWSTILRVINFPSSYKLLLIVGCCLIPLFASCKYYDFFLTDKVRFHMCSRKALLHVKNKSLDPNKQYTFFSDIHYFIGFLPNNVSEINTIFDKTKDISFETILKYHKPDIILVNNCLDESPSMRNDKYWKLFKKNPTTFGYHYEFVKDCPYYFLVLDADSK